MSHILFIVPKFPPPVVGGLEKQAYLLSLSLIKQGYNVDVLTRFNDGPVSGFDSPKIHKIPSFFQKVRLMEIVYVFFFFLINFRRYKVVHIHQHSWFGTYIAFIAFLFRLKVLIKLPNIGNHGILATKGPLKKLILNNATAFIAMNTIQKFELEKFGFKGKVFSIPNGIIPEIRGFEELRRTTDTLNLKFISIGRLVEQKGLHFLLDCWDKFKFNHSLSLDIWGDGPLKESLHKRIINSHFHNVRLMGYTPDPISTMLDYDIYINSSEVEGMSNAILEAMVCGQLVIASNVGGASEQLADTNFIFEFGNVDDLQELIQYVLDNPRLIKNVGDRNRKRILDTFQIDQIASQYITAYESL